jgi:hypothetical protein
MIDYGSVKQRLERFDIEHGLNAIVSDGWHLYADGAMREVNPLGALCEPPVDNLRRTKAIVHYHELKLRLATEEFNNYKNGLLVRSRAALNDGSPPPAPTPEVVARLKELKSKVMRMQKNFDKARQTMEAAKPEHIKNRERQAAENRSMNIELQSEIGKVTI